MMMKTRSLGVVATALAVCAPVAQAHDGHGDPTWFGSLLHYLIEPAHAPQAVVVTAGLVLAMRWAVGRMRRARRE